jgi:hypothetical protein
MATKKEMLEKVLKDMEKIGDIDASVVVSRDGLLIAADIPPDVNAEMFAAMSATTLGAAETAVSELGKELPERVITESKDAKIITCGAGPQALFVVMTKPEAGLGLILVEMVKSVEKIKMLLKEG